MQEHRALEMERDGDDRTERVRGEIVTRVGGGGVDKRDRMALSTDEKRCGVLESHDEIAFGGAVDDQRRAAIPARRDVGGRLARCELQDDPRVSVRVAWRQERELAIGCEEALLQRVVERADSQS